ncbi:hypothetical protein QBC46DRAFT_372426 [Diplogelasinospora grovesii]|uniref:Uncharacterized protein n=1 Tax=Diplogelasinospora grovesii TaxID=303347 RepID=A0AAN6NJ44_9PEZI|nr:hypothetical protein QBC46DRAFT_372426 [Diplogelasinospora grovesii]
MVEFSVVYFPSRVLTCGRQNIMLVLSCLSCVCVIGGVHFDGVSWLGSRHIMIILSCWCATVGLLCVFYFPSDLCLFPDSSTDTTLLPSSSPIYCLCDTYCLDCALITGQILSSHGPERSCEELVLITLTRKFRPACGRRTIYYSIIRSLFSHLATTNGHVNG